jgi:hypothetical protein
MKVIVNPNSTVTFPFGVERTKTNSAKCNLSVSASAVHHSNARKIRNSFHRDGANVRRNQSARLAPKPAA